MKICLFHPVLLPPRNYGGVERALLWLAKGLVERGHDVTLATIPESRLPNGVKKLEIDPNNRSAEVLLGQLPRGTEVVHFMAPPEAGVMEALPCPSLLTVHGQGQKGEVFPKNTVFLSRNHAERHGAKEFVYYGLDPDDYEFDPKGKKDWFLFLSKTSWSVKNLSGAIQYCKKAKVPLKISGGDRPYWARLQAAVLPRLTWEGPVDGKRKNDLLSHAQALVFPIRWPEPFGLVVVEALVSGTPVIAAKRGSLPELVNSGVGAVLDKYDDEEWSQAIHQVKDWSPEACRQHVIQNFHYRVFAENYEKVYRRVCGGEILHEQNPVSGDWRLQS